MGWEPLLEGDRAEPVWAAIRAIADEVGRCAPPREDPVDAALFWAYVAGAFDDDATALRYDAAIAALYARVERAFDSPGLFGGLAGAGWVLAHVSDGAGEFLAEVDAALLAGLGAPEPWRDDYDLIQGLVGFGVYFLERIRNGAPAARAGLDRVLDHLLATSERIEDGAAWHTRPELLPAWQREGWPAGYFNLGVAHGVPGVIGLLGSIAAIPDPSGGATAARARALCAPAMRWLRARRLPPHHGGRFPVAIARDGRASRPARTAWCYGDPGIAAAAWGAAIRCGNDPAEWIELALECAQRPAEACGVVDPNLCHGAAGLGHLCNRYFQASGDERFRDAARAWFERALAMRRSGEGIAGFTALRPDAGSGELQHRTASLFLDGTLGVALALLAAVRAGEPGWDRLLLCDLPPRATACTSSPC